MATAWRQFYAPTGRKLRITASLKPDSSGSDEFVATGSGETASRIGDAGRQSIGLPISFTQTM